MRVFVQITLYTLYYLCKDTYIFFYQNSRTCLNGMNFFSSVDDLCLITPSAAGICKFIAHVHFIYLFFRLIYTFSAPVYSSEWIYHNMENIFVLKAIWRFKICAVLYPIFVVLVLPLWPFHYINRPCNNFTLFFVMIEDFLHYLSMLSPKHEYNIP